MTLSNSLNEIIAKEIVSFCKEYNATDCLPYNRHMSLAALIAAAIRQHDAQQTDTDVGQVKQEPELSSTLIQELENEILCEEISGKKLECSTSFNGGLRTAISIVKGHARCEIPSSTLIESIARIVAGMDADLSDGGNPPKVKWRYCIPEARAIAELFQSEIPVISDAELCQKLDDVLEFIIAYPDGSQTKSDIITHMMLETYPKDDWSEDEIRREAGFIKGSIIEMFRPYLKRESSALTEDEFTDLGVSIQTFESYERRAKRTIFRRLKAAGYAIIKVEGNLS